MNLRLPVGKHEQSGSKGIIENHVHTTHLQHVERPYNAEMGYKHQFCSIKTAGCINRSTKANRFSPKVCTQQAVQHPASSILNQPQPEIHYAKNRGIRLK